MSGTVSMSSAEERPLNSAGAPAVMTPRTAACKDGSTLEYFATDREGPTIVCINALGLGLLAWRGLLERFSERYRVICWKPRGTYGQFRTLQDQVADLELILANEGVSQCKIVTWCSGAKVGLELYRRNPVATSMVLMNGAYMPLAGLGHLETPFEQTMFKLCQLVARRPAIASTMMKSMRSLLTGEVPGQGSASPLDGVSGGRELKAAIVEPFGTVESTVNYSQQVIDYLSHDIASSFEKVTAPVLLLAGQNDGISSPGMSRAIAERLPRASYAEIRSGTHYCLYEQPEAVFELVDRFFQAHAGTH